ncbi:unnamed protein product [Prorocentrum cordatum]|uniref:Pentacotripeptide-repeat region of PRORP domain-containing protein n=1 Tax=Prorocentrum cordatum TaxID=2364126 RepID=A0ABN9WK20_9DINO|nr:unnamed protein product [Polarella glacialis]
MERSHISQFLVCQMSSISAKSVQQASQAFFRGRTAQRLVMTVAALGAVLCALPPVSPATSSRLCGSSFQIDFGVLVSLCVLGYFVDSRSSKSTGELIAKSSLATAESVIGKAVLDRRRDACCAASVEERASPQKPGVINGSARGLRDQRGQRRRRRFDVHIIECAQREGVTHTLPRVSEVMRASSRLGHRDAALKLFGHMLKKGVVPGAHLIDKAVSNKFFQFVAETLDDKRMKRDGLSLLDLVRCHGIDPSPSTQNRLLSAWKGEPPVSVVEYFVKMKGDRVTLSNWAYRSIIVAYEHSDPGFVMKVGTEMERSGIQLQRTAYNAVLGACLQLGMHNEAQELFGKMADHAVAPNARSYGIMIRVYSYCGQFEKAIAIFDAMREQSFEPNRFAYHHTIHACIMSERVQYAVQLYNDSVQTQMPLCARTYVMLSRACRDIGFKDFYQASSKWS